MKMSGMTGTWIGMKVVAGPIEPQRYRCKSCGREIVSFTEKYGKLRECLRCQIRTRKEK